MTRTIQSWLTDMDGVLVHEGDALPGAADFVRALRDGVRPGGTPIDSQMPVRRITRHLDDTELRALYAYLRTLPARPYGGR